MSEQLRSKRMDEAARLNYDLERLTSRDERESYLSAKLAQVRAEAYQPIALPAGPSPEETRCTVCRADYPSTGQHAGVPFLAWGPGYRVCKRCVTVSRDARRAEERSALPVGGGTRQQNEDQKEDQDHSGLLGSTDMSKQQRPSPVAAPVECAFCHQLKLIPTGAVCAQCLVAPPAALTPDGSSPRRTEEQ
jgi:hypothetical protein